MRSFKTLLIVVLLQGCQGGVMPALPLGPLAPYRMDIQQGNVVTQEMIDKIKPGMTRSQVRFALGTPLVVDAFHQDRWDYVYFFQKAGTVVEQRRIAVFFKDDRMSRIEGDVVAVDPATVARPIPEVPAAKPPARSPQKK
jgi:outer membrane protein assembly factor BamE